MSKRLIKTSLDGIEHLITTKRRDGNSTRIVDNAIQLLYKGYIVQIIDHHPVSNIYLLRKVMKRIENEHSWMLEETKEKKNLKEAKERSILDQNRIVVELSLTIEAIKKHGLIQE